MLKDKIDLIATSTFGLEAVVKRELEALGFEDFNVENGKVNFKGNIEDIALANIWLRVADRVLLKMGEFKAYSFEELYNKTYALPWEDIIPRDANFLIEGKSVKSKLYSISDSQRIVEKAIVNKLKTKYKDVTWFEKSGPRYRIEVSLLKDVATLTIDTSGAGLHKRGYRTRQGEAPLKETLAAAMVLLSYWNKDRLLWDPFCGSGTIPIEAAMIGRSIAPGLDRKFDAEEWEIMDKNIWRSARKKAFEKIDYKSNIDILACDINPRSVDIAIENATNLGLEDDIQFVTKDFRNMTLKNEYGVVITNPPYGERIGEAEEVEQLYIDLGEKMKELDTWSNYLITSDKGFEKLFGKKADRKRKLYNGRIEVDYYQYYGPRPPKK